MYRFFLQPQVDIENSSIVGYELLLKEYKENRWMAPADFSAIPAKEIIDVLKKSIDFLTLKVESISVNLNQKQLLDDSMNTALIEIQNKLRPVKLVVELTEDDTDGPDIEDIISQLKRYYDRGITVSLDDVGVGSNSIAMFERLKPYLSEIKFALQDFKEPLESKCVYENLNTWKKMAKDNNLRFIFEGVEDEDTQEKVHAMGINIIQGYLYGKPRVLQIDENDPIS